MMSATVSGYRGEREHIIYPLEDVSHWGKKTLWSRKEALLLLAGHEPKTAGKGEYWFSERGVSDIGDMLDSTVKTKVPFKLTVLNGGRSEWGSPFFDLLPEEVLRWADVMDIPYKPELGEAVRAFAEKCRAYQVGQPTVDSLQSRIATLETENLRLQGENESLRTNPYANMSIQERNAELVRLFDEFKPTERKSRAKREAFLAEMWNDAQKSMLVENRRNLGTPINEETFRRHVLKLS